jgi:hypothetical protein
VPHSISKGAINYDTKNMPLLSPFEKGEYRGNFFAPFFRGVALGKTIVLA